MYDTPDVLNDHDVFPIRNMLFVQPGLIQKIPKCKEIIMSIFMVVVEVLI